MKNVNHLSWMKCGQGGSLKPGLDEVLFLIEGRSNAKVKPFKQGYSW